MKERGIKQEALASTLGTTQSSVSGWVNGKYEPAAATVFAVERSLGLEPGSLSRPLGYLPVEPASRSMSVEGAIAQSAHLGDDEKAALSAMYRVLAKCSTSAGSVDRPRNQLTNVNRPRGAAAATSARGRPGDPPR